MHTEVHSSIRLQRRISNDALRVRIQPASSFSTVLCRRVAGTWLFDRRRWLDGKNLEDLKTLKRVSTLISETRILFAHLKAILSDYFCPIDPVNILICMLRLPLAGPQQHARTLPGHILLLRGALRPGRHRHEGAAQRPDPSTLLQSHRRSLPISNPTLAHNRPHDVRPAQDRRHSSSSEPQQRGVARRFGTRREAPPERPAARGLRPQGRRLRKDAVTAARRRP